MSVTALFILAIYFGGLIVGLLYQPIFALFSYLWIFYNDPTTNWWGSQLPDLRYSLLAAVVALISAIRLAPAPRVPWTDSASAKLLILYALWIWIQTPWALNTAIHLDGAILFTKYAILSYVIYRITAERKNFERFLWAHVAGCFWFGWAAFTSQVVRRLETIGGPGVDDANLLAAHVITGLVIAGFLFIGSRGYQRWAVFLALPFILNTIVLTQSRGGFLALIAAGAAAWLASPKVYRRFVSIAGVLACVLLLMLSNELFWERISTIFESGEQAQQETRLQLLAPQLQMFLDYPLGAGHRGNEILSPQYMSADLLAAGVGRRSAHNTFIAALVDQGLPGALILLGLYWWGFRTIRRLKTLDALGLPPQLGIYRAALGAALASLMVSGLFLNLLKTEVQIWLIALLASLTGLCDQAIASQRESKQPQPAAPAPRTRAVPNIVSQPLRRSRHRTRD